MLLALGSLATGLLVSGMAPSERSAFLLVGPVLGVVSVFIWLLIRYSRIVIDPHGIVHRQVGYRIESTWDNVCAIEEHEGWLYLVLDNGSTTGPLLRGALSVTPPGLMVSPRPDLLAEGRLIDLTAFRWHWKHGDLAQRIRERTPHLNG